MTTHDAIFFELNSIANIVNRIIEKTETPRQKVRSRFTKMCIAFIAGIAFFRMRSKRA